LERGRRESARLKEQADELARAQLKSGEEEDLRARKEIAAHAAKLYQGCREGVEILYEGEDALASRLGRYIARLRDWARIDPGLSVSVGLLDSALAQMEEAASLLRKQGDRFQFDPEELERLEERLAEIQRLKRKYGAPVDEIIAMGEKIREDLKALERDEEEIPALEAASGETAKTAWEWAETLSSERSRAAKRLDREMVKELQSLGMAGTAFQTRFQEDEIPIGELPFSRDGKRLGEDGIDRLEFYLSPNPGEPVKPLAKIASGGELSRLMLALKSLVLARDDVPTLLFDEVDAGIGGRVAEIVGRRLKKVAAAHQVLCVTHLPQIAALADSHFVVQKKSSGGRTVTLVKKLNDRDRVSEVARMLGGIEVTEKARRHAEEMIKMQGSGKEGA
jgi:DNA repair protein RecN (Recombination protein N)